MDAMEFCKQLDRICKSHVSCESCPLEDGTCSIRHIGRNGESVVKIVEQWAKDHPVKTRQSEFLKMFPDAGTGEGILIVCPSQIDPKNVNSVYCNRNACFECRNNYWLTEVTDND